MSKAVKVDPAQLTISQELELNARAAAEETFDQKMAFETYYRMGDDRGLGKLAKHVGKGKSTLEGWSAKLRWQQRIVERTKAAAEYMLLQEDAKKEGEVKRSHLRIIDATVGSWVQKLKEGTIRINSIEDLEKLINLRWKIAGIPDRQVNPTHAQHGGGGASIDLRLRNMDKGQLQQFLYSTLKSIERVMVKKEEGGLILPRTDGDSKMSMDLTVTENQTESIHTPKADDPYTIDIGDDLSID